MKRNACLNFATIFSINACLAQQIIDLGPSLALTLPPAATFVEPGSVPSSNIATTASISGAQPVPTTTPPASASATASATASTSTSSSSSTSTSTPPTTSATEPLSAAASPGFSSSAKVGIGLGVPLAVIVLAIIGFLTLRYRRHTKVSRLRHHGNVAAAGLYPAVAEGDVAGGNRAENIMDVENGSGSQGLEKTDVHEIQGTEIPAYSRELAGSEGVRRKELPTRCNST